MRKKKDKHEEPHFSKLRTKSAKYKSKSQQSILHKHEQKMKQFGKKQERVHQLDVKIEQLQVELDGYKKERSYHQLNNESSANTINIIGKIHKCETDLQNLKKERDIILSDEDQINYLLESTFLIDKFIQLDTKEKELLVKEHDSAELAEILRCKQEITEQYLNAFDPGYSSSQQSISNSPIDMSCPYCKTFFTIEELCYLVCPNCGFCKYTLHQSDELSFKEKQDYDYRPQFTYLKSSHLDEWLKRFTSKENRIIPQDVLDKVILEANKVRIQDLNTLTEEQVKRFLKKLDLNEYYDNVITIINRINGRKPFTLTPEIENKIKEMFQQIQQPFEKHKPANRKNFLSYSYTISKFFQILGLHEFAKYFPLLKSVDKLRQQDEIFKKIVEEMAQKDKSINWVFYPSI